MLSNPFVTGKFSLEQFPGEDSWGTQWTVGGQKGQLDIQNDS